MKVIIQVPCYNEAAMLGVALDALPRHLAGVDKVEILIVDDGSADDTVKVAKALRVIASIEDPAVIERILEHLGRDAAPVDPAHPSRAPPERDLLI